jgi:diguanylate cyclase (GGDEF)-like protein/PAS domain S-box-containing protein
MALRSVRKLRRGLMALSIALPALFVIAAGIAVVQDYRATIKQAESDMRSVAVALEEHAMRTFGEADTRVRITMAEIARRGLSPTAADEGALHDILAAATRDSPLTSGAVVLSPDGWVRASAATFPVKPVDSRGREYYTDLRAHARKGILVSRPLAAPSAEMRGIPVARRIDNPDGSMKMIVGVGVDSAYFDRFYRDLELGYGIKMMLVRRDGWVITETPMRADAGDHNVANTPAFHLLASSPIGVYDTEDGAAGGAQVVGYASLAQSPVVAVASVARAEVLQSWTRRSQQVVGICVLSSVLVLCLLRFLWLQLASLEAAQEGLARRNEDVNAERRRFQELVDGIDGVVWEALLPDFHFTYVSGNAEAISGYRAEQWMSDRHFWCDTLCTGPDGKHAEPVLSTARPGLIKPIEHHVVTPDGKDRWLRSNVMLAQTRTGDMHVRGVTTDITPQKVSELQLYEANHVDPLTRLPNRRAVLERMGHAMLLAEHNQSMVAVVLIDIDNFNTLNDSLGHEQGDEALVQVAGRLRGCLGRTDMLGRMGGDEFAVVMEEVDRVALKAEHLAECISAALEHNMSVGHREVYLTASMGIALFPQDGTDVQTLLRSADAALHRVKAAGRNGWQFFDSSMARQVEYRLDMETGLRQAIERGELRLYYQPQRSLEDGKIVGAEALVRWERPGVGMVPTQEFIRVAEENGFIVALGNWVLQAACKQAMAWNEAGMPLRIAVNVSVVQLQQPDFVAQVRSALTLSGLPTRCLELEITEGAFVADLLDALDKLHQIKAMGVELAVDDFGTGYSSLSYLKQMPVDRLKIDQSFVRDIPNSADDCAIVRAILAMASNLKLQVIAEGVESEDQLAFLHDEGCQEIQGYLLSPPVNPDNFIARFRNAGRMAEASQ